MGNVDNGGGLHVGRAEVIWQISVPFSQFFCELSKRALDYNIVLGKKKENRTTNIMCNKSMAIAVREIIINWRGHIL